jgi:hypothetical protein
MNSSYGLLEEDYMHLLLDCSTNKNDYVGNNTNLDSNQIYYETICRILPTVVPDQTLRHMRHKKGSHILKGYVARCEGCHQQFDTKTLIWNAIKKME